MLNQILDSLQFNKYVTSWYQRLLASVLQSSKLAIVSVFMASLPASAADFVSVNYGLFQRSLPIESLAAYAETGVADSEIKAYLKYLKPQQRDQLRQALQTHAPLDVVAVSQFLYTAQGEILLERLGSIIRTSSTATGFYAIRGAMIAAAADRSEGLTLMNVLRKFPSKEVQIDIGEGLEIVTDTNKLVEQTQTFILETVRQTARNAIRSPLPPQPRLENLQSPGSITGSRISMSVPATKTQRELPFDLYLPKLLTVKNSKAQVQPAPVLVISHGFGSDRGSFQYLAEHLRSYGFAVVVPEHPGSNAQQIQNWLSGRTALAANPVEFVRRPLDIRAVLDTLTVRSQTDSRLKGRVNLQQIGILGQSFGGYTALAAAGASIDADNLRQACQQEVNTLNLSLLLQCRALEAPNLTNLSDPRIKAVFTINPIVSAVFGKKSLQQISVPTLIVGSGNDTVAPLLVEQAQPFSWLTAPNKYLIVIQNATHFSAIGVPSTSSSSEGLPIPQSVVGDKPEITQRYIQMLSVAFFKAHLLGESQYKTYLSDAYLYSVSRAPFRLGMLQTIQPELFSFFKAKKKS